MTVDDIKAKYEPRILALMESLGAQAREQGFLSTEPELVLGDEEYLYDMGLKRNDKFYSVTFTILEEVCREGEGTGIAFGINIVSQGGRIVSGMTPYNYTSQLWLAVDDAEAIEQRFAMLEEATLSDNINWEE